MKLPSCGIQTKLIILDRDGVINQDRDDYVKTADEWIPLPGSLEAIARLSKAGFTLAVATNQSGLGRNIFTLADLDAMHCKMYHLLGELDARIDVLAYCPHAPEASCACRKPKPGLIKQIESQLGFSARNAFFVGDKQSDLEAATKAECIPVLVRTGNGKKTESVLRHRGRSPSSILVFDDLQTFADTLLGQL